MQHDTREREDALPTRADTPFDEMIHRFEGQYGRNQSAMIAAFGHAGWKRCGQGKNGRVAASPCGQYVVRISQEDEGFDRHVGLCQTHADNKHFPKVHAHKTLPDGSLVTIMEKLAPLPKHLSTQRAQLTRQIAFGDTPQMSPSLREAAEIIRSQSDLQKDIHGGDIMYRKSDRSLVITDPFR